MVRTEQIDLVQPSASSASQTPCLLVADDQPHILDAIELLVRPEGYHVDRARSPQMVLDALRSGSYDALLIDLNYTRDTTSGKEGLDLLAQVTALDAQLPVIVMTAWANVQVAVEAMRDAVRGILFKSHGRMRGCWRFSPTRSTCTMPCGALNGWRRRIGCSALRACRR